MAFQFKKGKRVNYLVSQFLSVRTGGGVMLFALFIAVVLVLITSLILSMNAMSSRSNDLVLRKHVCRINVRNAIVLALAEPDLFETGQTKAFSLFDEFDDSVSVTRNFWGLYETFTASTKVQDQKLSQSVLANTFWDNSELPSLWLAPSQFRCKAGGTTVVEGKCNIPGGRFEKTTLNKVPFSGNIPSSAQLSNAERIPDLPEYLSRLKFEEIISQLPPDCIMSTGAPFDGYRTFAEPCIVTYLSGSTMIEKGNISGNQILICNGTLALSEQVQMKDILIIAQSILFENNFDGSLQAFARDSIITGDNCGFHYPSAFVIYSENNDNAPAKIVIGSESKLAGTILCWSIRPTIRNHFLTSLSNNSRIEGNVFCNGYTEMNGVVVGHVITRNTLLHLAGGTHENTLFNCTISENDKNMEQCGLNLLSDAKKMKKVKMLK
ncbi:hypothetical protein SDC9_50347 [bioreactor metagenome]|uniref:Uncharacterized protein n=1 Tax=bioreactor metagenome TaxID=1076179 RepID=A0A644WKG6_9ZZZZ